MILIEVSPGELIDKLTILEIKKANIRDETKLGNVRREYVALTSVYRANIPERQDVDRLRMMLKDLNEQLWRIEDKIRDYDRLKHFGPEFVALAQSVYRTNDQRAAIKREINNLLDSRIIEEKSYPSY